VKNFISKNFEWIALSTGIILLAAMDPYNTDGISLCLFEMAGFNFCPGEGLGHSIAYIFRGDIGNAMESNILGLFALLIIFYRIFCLINFNYFNKQI